MPDNPLAALLANAGGDTNLDPAMLNAQPQLKLAQLMMQQGTDTSPVGHPLQALARIAQTGAGQAVQGRALSELGQAYSTSAEGLANALGKIAPGHPLIAALRSPDPNVRMMAIKQGTEALMKLPEQQWERQKFNMNYNKPELTNTATDPNTGQKTFMWATPANKGTSAATMPAGAGGDDPISQARAAIARGADRAKVIQRLQESGIDPSGL